MKELLVTVAALALLAPPGLVADDLETGEYTAEINGFEIFYEVRGSGPVCMVMPMAWGISHDGLERAFEDLEEFLTLVYFDPRGMGRSGDIKTDSDMAMAAVREDLDALRTHLGLEKVILLGWSNGGMNVLKYAASHPEAVSHLIVLHSIAFLSPEDEQKMVEEYSEVIEAIGELMQPGLSEEEQNAGFRKLIK